MIKPYEVEHRSIEMHCEIAGEPLGPCPFPFWQQRKSPLDRSENRKHTQENLLAVYGGPPSYSEDYQGDYHNNLVDADYRTGGQRGKP